MMRCLCLGLLIFLMPVMSTAQPPALQLSYSRGNIWQHSPKLSHLFGQPQVVMLGFSYRQFADRDWAQRYPGIRSGAELFFIDFDNTILGRSVGASTFVALRFPGTRRLYVKFNGGMAWVSNPFHPDENPDNPTLGGPLTFSLQGFLFYEIALKDGWRLRPGIQLHHLSTCSYYQPNTGVNVPAITLEVGFNQPALPDRISRQREPYKGSWELLLQGGVSRRSVEELDRQRFWITTASVGLLRRLSEKSKLGSELTFISSQGDKNLIASRVARGHRGPADHQRLGWAIQHELVFGDVSFYNAVGVYLYDPGHIYRIWYQRYGLRYTIGNRLVVSPTLLAHLGSADFLELSLGYRIF